MGPARMSFVLLWEAMWAWVRVRVKEVRGCLVGQALGAV